MMICEKCKSEWNTPRSFYQSNKCPFCGATLIESKSQDTMENVVKQIFEQFGSEILLDKNKFLAIFVDYAPKMKKERKMLAIALDEGVAKFFVNCAECDRETNVDKARKSMNPIMSETAVDTVIQSLIFALGWKLELQKSALQNMNHYQLVQQNCENGTHNTMLSIGDEFNFGRYNSNPIRWRVVDIDDEKGVLLVIAIDSLDSKKRNDICWLNEFFYKYSFNGSEKNCIFKYDSRYGYVSCFRSFACDINYEEEALIREHFDFWYWKVDNYCVCIKKVLPDTNEDSLYFDEKSGFPGYTPALYLKTMELSSQISEISKNNALDIRQNEMIKELSENDKFEFGEYSGKSIVWRVIKKTCFTITAISEKTICFRKFHTDRTTNKWSKSILRDWLNGEFYNKAFNDIEKMSIIDINHELDVYSIESSKRDKVFLLSKKEVSHYFNNEKKRACGSWWWLRTPIRTTRVERVNGYGSFSKDGSCVDDPYGGVRPALKIKLYP